MPLAHWVPGLDNLFHYHRAWLRPNVQAGLSVAAIQILTAITYVQIVGFPPQVGLYVCILPMLIYALIGSPRQLMVGSDAATVAMVATAITPLTAGDPQCLVDLSIIVAIMAGLFSIVAGLTCAGFIASFPSRPILAGYLNGIGLSLLVGQLGKLFGYEAAISGLVAGILAPPKSLLHTHWPTLILGSLSLLLMVLLPRRFPQLPGALCGVLLASLAAVLLGLDRYGVELLGEAPAGLPRLSWPQTSLEELKSLLRDVTGITVVSFCSAMPTARSFTARCGYSINANHEFAAFGLTNIGAGASQGFAISGADSRTTVNDMVGGKTQLVGVVAALAIAATLLLLNKPLGWVPMPALGVILLLTGWGLIDAQALKDFWEFNRFELSLYLLTTVGVLSVGVLSGIFVAVSIAVLCLLYYIYHPSDVVLGWMHGIDGQARLAKYPQATILPGLVIYRFDAPLLSFNADYFKQRMLAVVDGSERPNTALLNVETITSLNINGLVTLHEMQQILKAQGVHLSLARVTGWALDLLQRSGMLGEIKPSLASNSVRSGIGAYHYWLRQQERLAAQAAATSRNA